MEEEWRDVVGAEGLYQVSNMGGVRSVDRHVRVGHNAFRSAKGKLLAPCCDVENYLLVSITYTNGESKLEKVHRLVAKAFIPHEDDTSRLLVNHLDENPSNNRVDNLAWATDLENKIYSIRLREERGEVHHKARLTIDDVREIRLRRKEGETVPSIAKSYPFVTKSAISCVVYGKNWKWVK